MNDKQIENSLEFIKGLPPQGFLTEFAVTKTIGIALVALEQLQEERAEVERLKAELHKPIGTGLVVQYPHTNEAVGVTQFLNNQPEEKVWCRCGAIYPKGQEHKH